jgi:hypothetical protein
VLLALLSLSIPVREGGDISSGAECSTAALDNNCVCEVGLLPFLLSVSVDRTSFLTNINPTFSLPIIFLAMDPLSELSFFGRLSSIVRSPYSELKATSSGSSPGCSRTSSSMFVVFVYCIPSPLAICLAWLGWRLKYVSGPCYGSGLYLCFQGHAHGPSCCARA